MWMKRDEILALVREETDMRTADLRSLVYDLMSSYNHINEEVRQNSQNIQENGLRLNMQSDEILVLLAKCDYLIKVIREQAPWIDISEFV